MLTKQAKQKVVAKHRTHKEDTGSVEVTAGLLSERINQLAEHLKTHKKDKHSRKGLIGMVSKRRKLLKYLAKNDPERHTALTKALGLKK